MRLIYQIDKIDADKLKFVIGGKEYEEFLSSFAWKKHIGNASLVLVHPVSILFNKKLLNQSSNKPPLSENFKNIIKEIIENEEKRDEFFKNPLDFLNEHPFKNEAEFLPIHSIGEFEGVKFEGIFDDIVLEIFIDMCQRFLKDEFKELYIDVSTGFNIYVSALLEAVRQFYVFASLMNWLNKNKRPKVFIIFSDPAIGSTLKQYKIYQEELKYKVFFTSPIKNDDIKNYSLSGKLAGKLLEDRKLKREIQKYLEGFALIFSSIKNNIPLGIYHFGYHDYDEVKNFLSSQIENLKEKLYAHYQKSPKLEKTDWLKLLFSLAFYLGIIEVLKDKDIKKYDDKGVSWEEIEEKFRSKNTSIYKIFDLSLNIVWLGRELRNLEENIWAPLFISKFDISKELWNLEESRDKELINKANNNWVLLTKYMYGEGNNLEKRNFLAHCGFERNITEVRKQEDKLYFRWTSDAEKIKDVGKVILKEV